MKNKTVFDEMYQGLSNAVADIREKVVEEPWYGRSLSENAAPEWPPAQQEQQASLGSLTRNVEPSPDLDVDR